MGDKTKTHPQGTTLNGLDLILKGKATHYGNSFIFSFIKQAHFVMEDSYLVLSIRRKLNFFV